MGLLSRKSKDMSNAPVQGGAGTAAAIKPEEGGTPQKKATFAEEDTSKADAAAKIQAIRRGKADRVKVTEEKKVSQMREAREAAATKLQAIQKGKSTRAKVTTTASTSAPAAGSSIGEKLSMQMQAFVACLSGPCAKCSAGGGGAAKADAPKEAASETASASVKLPEALRAKVNILFSKMDTDGDGVVTRTEAQAHFKSFPKLAATAMFNEVDTDKSNECSLEEMQDFWTNVLSTGKYEEEELLEELDTIIEGGAWADFDDGRTT